LDQVPNPLVRNERQPLNGNALDELAGGAKKHFDQLHILGEEEDISEQETRGFARVNRLDLVLGSFGEKKECA
jgi:hypothetical protein